MLKNMLKKLSMIMCSATLLAGSCSAVKASDDFLYYFPDYFVSAVKCLNHSATPIEVERLKILMAGAGVKCDSEVPEISEITSLLFKYFDHLNVDYHVLRYESVHGYTTKYYIIFKDSMRWYDNSGWKIIDFNGAKDMISRICKFGVICNLDGTTKYRLFNNFCIRSMEDFWREKTECGDFGKVYLGNTQEEFDFSKLYDLTNPYNALPEIFEQRAKMEKVERKKFEEQRKLGLFTDLCSTVDTEYDEGSFSPMQFPYYVERMKK